MRAELKPIFRAQKEGGLVSQLEVGGLPIEINASHPRHIEYINRVAYPISQRSVSINPRVRFLAQEQDLKDIVPFLRKARALANTKDEIVFGEVADNLFFLASEGSKYINFSWQEEGTTFHFCLGSHPEWGVASFLKIHLLQEASQKDQSLRVFHAGSAVHLPTCSGLVFSTPDRGRKPSRKFGKTSAVLSLTTAPGGEYAFSSNDEVALGTRDGNSYTLTIPNEIPVQQKTLESVFKEKMPRLEEWRGDDPDPENRAYITTSGGLVSAGYTIKALENVRHWMFVDLQQSKAGNQITSLTFEEAYPLLKLSVFERRMRQTKTNPYLAEQDHVLECKLPDTNPQTLFAVLKREDVHFWRLSGGVDPEEIREAVGKIVYN